MNIFSTASISDRAVITCIQTDNKNNTRSAFSSNHTYGILQGVINGTGRKQTQNEFNRYSKVWRVDKQNNQLNNCDI